MDLLEAYFPGYGGNWLNPQILKVIISALPENVVLVIRKIQKCATLVELARKVVKQLEGPGLNDIKQGYLSKDNILGIKISIHQYDLAKARNDYSKVGPVTHFSEFLASYVQTRQERQAENERRQKQQSLLLPPLEPLGSFYGETVLGRALESAGFHYHLVLFSSDNEIGLHTLSQRINTDNTIGEPENQAMGSIPSSLSI